MAEDAVIQASFAACSFTRAELRVLNHILMGTKLALPQTSINALVRARTARSLVCSAACTVWQLDRAVDAHRAGEFNFLRMLVSAHAIALRYSSTLMRCALRTTKRAARWPTS